MQDHVGKVCKVCQKNIWRGEDVVICPGCGTAYHFACWNTMETCPRCGRVTAKTKAASITTAISSDRSRPFSNIGEKLQTVAVISAVGGTLIGIVLLIVMAVAEMLLAGLLAALVIAFLSWISAFALYGFGTLIVQSKTQTDCRYEILQRLDEKEE